MKKQLSIMRYILCIYAFVLLGGFMILLTSCEQEEDSSGNRKEVLIPPTGEPVTVNFTIGEREYGNNGVSIRNAMPLTSPPSLSDMMEQPLTSSPEKMNRPDAEKNGIQGMEEAFLPISEGIFMSASIQENDPPVNLRAAFPLDIGRKARVVAYDVVSVPNDTILLSYADYEVDAGLNLVPYGTPPLTVPAGNVMFVAYSFNDATTMDPFANDTIYAIGSRDPLWGDTTVTVGPGNLNVHIILDHLFSRIMLHASVDPIIGNNIAAMGIASFMHTFPSLNIHSGQLTSGTPGQISFTWLSTVPAPSWDSNYHPVFTNGNPPELQIGNVMIDSNPYPGPWQVNYTAPLESGKEYTLNVNFVPPCVAVTGISISSSSNSVVVGNTVTLTATGLTPSNATHVRYIWEVFTGAGWTPIDTTTVNSILVNVLNVGSNQFRVTATNNCTSTPPTATTDVTGTPKIPSPNGGSAARITWEPPSTTYTAGRYVLTYNPRDAGLYFKYGSLVGVYSDINGQNKILPPQGMSPSPSLFNPAVDLPWNLTGVTGTGQTAWDNVPYTSTLDNLTATFHNAANVKVGKGDPCRLVGLDLNYIQNTMTASEPDKSKYDNATWRLPTGTENFDFSGQTTNLITTSVHWWAENEPGNISYGVAGGEFPSKNHVNGGILKFLPAAGDRSTDGNYTNSAGLYGWYWGSTSSSPTHGDLLQFGDTYIAAFSTTNKELGLSVRCVYAKTVFSAYWYQALTGGPPWIVTRYSDETDNYIFPWNTTATDIDVESNIGCTFDNTSSVIGSLGTVTPGSSFASPGGNTVYPYTFTFNNTNYTTTANYSLKFNSNPAGSGDVTRTLSRGRQEWTPSGVSSASAGYLGLIAPADINVTDNIVWSYWFDNWTDQGVPSTASNWTTARAGTQGFSTPVTAGATQWDDRLYEPVAYSGAYPAAGILTKNTPFQINITAFASGGSIINAPLGSVLATRTARLNIRNESAGGTALAAIPITQYYPRANVVSYSGTLPRPEDCAGSVVSPGFIPVAGGTYTVTVSTNITNLGIRVYAGATVVVTSYATTQPINNEGGSNVTINVTIPNSSAFRLLTFYFYASNLTETKFAEIIQTGSLISDAATYSVTTAPRIYIVGSGDNARLMLTQNVTNLGAYFQAGSIVGRTNTTTAPFNPTTTVPAAMSNTWTSGMIDGHTADHTPASLQNGIGDPCKLLGFTAAQVREAAANGCALDNKQYRTPTGAENAAMGAPGNFSSWQDPSNTFHYGRWFGPGNGSNVANRQFLPGNGFWSWFNSAWSWTISGEGSSTGQSGSGSYWDSDMCSSHHQVHFILFSAQNPGSQGFYNHDDNGQSAARGVRCVAQ